MPCQQVIELWSKVTCVLIASNQGILNNNVHWARNAESVGKHTIRCYIRILVLTLGSVYHDLNLANKEDLIHLPPLILPQHIFHTCHRPKCQIRLNVFSWRVEWLLQPLKDTRQRPGLCLILHHRVHSLQSDWHKDYVCLAIAIIFMSLVLQTSQLAQFQRVTHDFSLHTIPQSQGSPD